MHDLSPREVVDYLQKEGCEFDISDHTYIYTTHYVYVSCDNPKIAFQKIEGSALNTIMYNWQLDSLNVSVSAAILLYEAVRQRQLYNNVK